MKNESCLECGNKIVKYGKKFCSRRCSGLYNNRNCKNLKNARKGPLPKVIENKTCLKCGDILNPGAKKYCSRECQNLYIRDKRAAEWLNGNLTIATVKGGLSRTIRTYLIEKNNYKCSRCGWGEINSFSNRIPLEIDHIDGNAYNNKPENIAILCPNCHSLTKFHKGLNKNNSDRTYMRQYFKKRRERKSQRKNYLNYKLKTIEEDV